MIQYENGIEYHWDEKDLITIDTINGNTDNIANRIYELRLTIEEVDRLKNSTNQHSLIADIAEDRKSEWLLRFEDGEEITSNDL